MIVLPQPSCHNRLKSLNSFSVSLLQRPIMTLWARIIESDKPVFTLIFGGSAAFAKAISEVAKHL
jgi:hypothetical protein